MDVRFCCCCFKVCGWHIFDKLVYQTHELLCNSERVQHRNQQEKLFHNYVIAHCEVCPYTGVNTDQQVKRYCNYVVTLCEACPNTGVNADQQVKQYGNYVVILCEVCSNTGVNTDQNKSINSLQKLCKFLVICFCKLNGVILRYELMCDNIMSHFQNAGHTHIKS